LPLFGERSAAFLAGKTPKNTPINEAIPKLTMTEKIFPVLSNFPKLLEKLKTINLKKVSPD